MKINLRKLTLQIANQIVKRTKSGKDYNLQTFKPYTQTYAKKKKKRKVDLTLSGLMLQSLRPIKDDTIGFNNTIAQNRAIYNQSHERYFMGLDTNNIKYIQQYIQKQITKQLQKETKKWKLR